MERCLAIGADCLDFFFEGVDGSKDGDSRRDGADLLVGEPEGEGGSICGGAWRLAGDVVGVGSSCGDSVWLGVGGGSMLRIRPGGADGVRSGLGDTWGGLSRRLPIVDDIESHSSRVASRFCSRDSSFSRSLVCFAGSDVRMSARSVWTILSSSCPRRSFFIRSSRWSSSAKVLLCTNVVTVLTESARIPTFSVTAVKRCSACWKPICISLAIFSIFMLMFSKSFDTSCPAARMAEAELARWLKLELLLTSYRRRGGTRSIPLKVDTKASLSFSTIAVASQSNMTKQ